MNLPIECTRRPIVRWKRSNVSIRWLKPGVSIESDAIVLGSKTAFGMTAGGGIDFTVSRHFAIRPVQAEYFLTKFPDGLNNRQNNFRYSAGIAFRFGG
jgi:opacity protein-like surface antigen